MRRGKSKHNMIHGVSTVGIGASIALGIVGLMLVCPITSDAALADSYDSINAIANVDVAPVLSIAADVKVDLDITPKSTGVFSSDDINLVISTNSRNGYSLYMSALDGNGALKNNNDSIADQINPVTPDTKSDSFTANTWGYSLDEGDDKTYQPIPVTNQAIDYVTSSSAENVRTLTFGAKVDTSLAAGQYSTVVTISAVANPITLSTLHDLTYMQQMTSEICNNTISADMKNPVTKQLIDTRDGKSYWVAKLADGNCWMTQNLALDITDAGLSASDTDIKEDWGRGSEYKPNTTITDYSIPSTATDNNSTDSWNIGKWILATPTITDVWCGGDNPDSCIENGLVNVRGNNFKPGYQATTSNWTYPDGSIKESTLVAINCTEWSENTCIAGTYDEHYLLGNYYQWNTATAGTGAIATNLDDTATGSICPKGWKLPHGGAFATSLGGYSYLLKKYGITSKAIGEINGETYDIKANPLYFTYTGMVKPGSDGWIFDSIIGEGMYTTSTAAKEGTIFALQFNGGNALFLNGNSGFYRYYSRAVRCINNPDI